MQRRARILRLILAAAHAAAQVNTVRRKSPQVLLARLKPHASLQMSEPVRRLRHASNAHARVARSSITFRASARKGSWAETPAQAYLAHPTDSARSVHHDRRFCAARHSVKWLSFSEDAQRIGRALSSARSLRGWSAARSSARVLAPRTWLACSRGLSPQCAASGARIASASRSRVVQREPRARLGAGALASGTGDRESELARVVMTAQLARRLLRIESTSSPWCAPLPTAYTRRKLRLGSIWSKCAARTARSARQNARTLGETTHSPCYRPALQRFATEAKGVTCRALWPCSAPFTITCSGSCRAIRQMQSGSTTSSIRATVICRSGSAPMKKPSPPTRGLECVPRRGQPSGQPARLRPRSAEEPFTPLRPERRRSPRSTPLRRGFGPRNRSSRRSGSAGRGRTGPGPRW